MAEKKLTETRVKAERGPTRLSDGNGLYLVVRKPSKTATANAETVRKAKGSKSWSYVWIRQGQRRELGLGGYPALTLAGARKVAAQIREDVALGNDPLANRRKENPKTFGAIADLVLLEVCKTSKHEKHADQWTRALTVLCKPIRKRLIEDITTRDVLRVVKPIWEATPETGKRLRSRIERVLDYATAHGFRAGDNPARLNAHFKILMGSKKTQTRKHYAAMPYAEVPAFIEQLQGKDTMPAKALAFTILTGARTQETLGAIWSEIDFENNLWTIPAERMKAAREHTVPLTDMVLEILRPLYDMRLSKYVFAGQSPRKPLSNMTMAMTMRRMGVGAGVATVHGFRSSFRDWAGDKTSVAREVAEAAIAHSVGSVVERSYRRGDALEKRRGLMNQWSDYCAGKHNGEIVRLHG